MANGPRDVQQLPAPFTWCGITISCITHTRAYKLAYRFVYVHSSSRTGSFFDICLFSRTYAIAKAMTATVANQANTKRHSNMICRS